ncbi:hypothetical protein [Sphingosinicella humi]|uniref:hypothetical protein n=1 Tax=Allosphingosinicella humi TaxID=2068657 RepID=UPI0011B28929|nr:hypothetical protein [Sphingosinicella humi]
MESAADTRHHDAELHDCGQRPGWWSNLQDALEGADLVFVDPDNGLSPPRLTPGQKKSIKSIFWSEVAALRQPGRILVVYHHQTRAPGGHQAEAEAIGKRLLEEGVESVLILRAKPWSPRLFIIVDADEVVRERAIRFAHHWKQAVSIVFESKVADTARDRSELEFKPLALSHSPPNDPDVRRAVRILSMVHELHKVGYQRLRIAGGMGPSGCHWRCSILPADMVCENGWEPKWGARGRAGEDGLAAEYSTGEGVNYFGWSDAASDNARQLASKFVVRFPDIAKAGRGLDFPYAGWLTSALGRAETGQLPVFFADYEIHLDPQTAPPPVNGHPHRRTLANRELEIERIPPPGSGEWESFALTFDGERWSLDELAHLDRERAERSLTQLRARLYFKQRKAKWNPEPLTDADQRELNDIIEKIRERVAKAGEALA